MSTGIAEDVREADASDVSHALAVGLMGIDASRRVGWAKYFDAFRKVDQLEEELRQTRDELKWLRRSYSRLVGFINHLPIRKSPVFQKEVKSHYRAERQFRHEDAYQKGVAVARDHQAYVEQWTDDDYSKIMSDRADKRLVRSVRLVDLYEQARQAGHDVGHYRAIDGEEFQFECSCGQTGSGSSSSVLGKQRNHATQVVHGVDYSEFVRMKKRGEIE